MQRIERYGVIALVVLLVTILAVSLWGENKDGFKFWKSDSAQAAAPETARGARRNGANALERSLPMNQALPTPLSGQGSPLDGQGSPLDGQGSPAAPYAPAPSLANPSNGPGGATPANPFPALEGAAPIATPASDPGAPRALPLGNGLANDATGPGATPRILGLDREAAPAPAPKSPAPVSGTRTYVVKEGDTLGAIASRELGSTSRWPEIQELNGSLDPAKLRAGTKLVLPAGKSVASTGKRETPAPAKPAAPKSGGSSYVVKSGDSLTRIAANELGSAQRWTEIRDLNPGIDPKKLVVGAKLALPRGAAASTTLASAGTQERIGWGPKVAGKKSRVQ
jgi:nucleoid-associated protein YgaU